ncbi:ABC transporter ATP-binding protein [Salinigranum rubrum]|uniref:Probable branched-chain amino acid transport ATP-binding protein LivG n=1 Tax=Salinigranum rubrum TaxID=755307 RepID=A0A2I8VJD9_9EURY|nr:ABC transporter ATP-binding protein [Salinigranum rubrum]AUV82038.1 ABC transporter ATP-binding protein [Salinigranum rubrum]
MTLLDVADLRRSFGSIRALDGASFTVERGELVGVIGPNGAGKTTLFNCVSGVLESDAGTVRFDGEDVTDVAPYELPRRGMVRTFQQTREFSTMSVGANMLLPTPDHPGERAYHAVFRTDAAADRERAARDQAEELLAVFDLDTMVDEYAGSLSGGQRKLLELARALMLDPDLLLLDEPFAGVNPTLTRDIAAHIEALNDDGLTLLIIEHELETLTDLVDRLIVMTNGSVLTTGTPEEILEDQRVIDAYLGN